MSDAAELIQSFKQYLVLKIHTDAMYSASDRNYCLVRRDFGVLNSVYILSLDNFIEEIASFDSFVDRISGLPERRGIAYYYILVTDKSFAAAVPELEILRKYREEADKRGIILDFVTYSCEEKRYNVTCGGKISDKKLRAVLDNAASFFETEETDRKDIIAREVRKSKDAGRRLFYTGRRVGPNPIIFLIVANILIFIAGVAVKYKTGADYIQAFGIQDNALIMKGEVWRLVTSMFLHGGLAHLVGNMMFLMWIGRSLYPHYSNGHIWTIYLLSGLAGNVLGLVFSDYLSLGASGAIMGLGGAMFYRMLFDKDAKQFRHLGNFASLALSVIFNLVFGLIVPGIDNYGHFGGFIGGFLCAMVIAKTSGRHARTEDNNA